MASVSSRLQFKDPVIHAFVSFVMSEKFQSDFEDFFVQHAHKFDEGEQSLEAMTIYRQFQDLFEDHISDFLKQHDLSETEFLQKVRLADTEDPNAKEYFDIVFASMEYNAFAHLMVLMKPTSEEKTSRKRKIDGDSKEKSDSVSFDAKDGSQEKHSDVSIDQRRSGDKQLDEEK